MTHSVICSDGGAPAPGIGDKNGSPMGGYRRAMDGSSVVAQ